ncbi:putative diguanylate cyclase AdrA [Massilia sp. Bi118]|uniref:GGDEF domain-containing protein n=1 Tax=Massilia sp. Bi118 TaxID=2822346 RepID=UPI001DB72A17|nr:GGDEF domain-containing protein [Massilia sp. Bi118]CAH0140067.1 putative diguanylate cyclase AdrA [Massilia sp. Bi118]
MDSFTLVVASALVAGIMAASMLLLYRASSRQRCLLDWSLSGLCFLASNLIGAVALKYRLDTVLAPAVANMFYIAGHAGILVGVRRHLFLRPRYDLAGLLALAVLCVHALPYTQGSVLHRLFLFTPVVVGINLGVVWLLRRQPDDGVKRAYLPLMALELLFAAQMALRLILEFMGSQFLQTSGSLFVLVFLSVSTMACALIVTHQQELALRRASLTDVLTGWLNRRALHDIARREFRRCRRNATPLFFITFDIDHFKSINDRYGHSVGDAAICHVTTLAARALRGYDAMFRIGGEEFAVVVGGGALADVQGIAQRLRELVANTPLLAQGLSVPMTVSVGVAAARDADAQWEDVLKRADEAMYHAKQHGRDRVSVHGIDLAEQKKAVRLHAVVN